MDFTTIKSVTDTLVSIFNVVSDIIKAVVRSRKPKQIKVENAENLPPCTEKHLKKKRPCRC